MTQILVTNLTFFPYHETLPFDNFEGGGFNYHNSLF